MRDAALEYIHILASGDLGLLFVIAVFTGELKQSLIVVIHFRTDNDLELTGVGEAPFDHAQGFNL